MLICKKVPRGIIIFFNFMGKSSKKSFVLLAIMLSFFIARKSFSAAFSNGDILFSEIAWMGTINSANDEWLELKNNSSQVITLDNWLIKSAISKFQITLSGIIPANGFFLLERTDDDSVPNISANQIYTGALSNSSEKLQLLDTNGEIIDLVDASNGWPAGDNATKQSAERQADLSWSNSLLPGGTPQNSSSPEIIPDTDESKNNVQADTNNTSSDTIRFGDILISEFVADPDEDDYEWIEIYNTTPHNISLENWAIADGKDTSTTLSGTLLPFGFFVIDNPKGKLNNDGDIIVLKNNEGLIIDQVTYGSFDDGDISDNAPATAKPNSVARQTEYYNSNHNNEDFKITSTPSKAAPNIIISSLEKDSNLPTNISKSKPATLLISEIFPDPLGTDYEKEFIEIYNPGKTEINLQLFSLENKAGQNFIFPNRQIKSEEYLAFYRENTGLALNNQNDSIKLKEISNGRVLQTVNYRNTPAHNSYNLATSTNSWTWEIKTTPGSPNQIKKINQEPIIVFDIPTQASIGQPVFGDSSDTIDPENDPLSYTWDFGDGTQISLPNAEHTFMKAGKFTITLNVRDKTNEASLKKIITIIDPLSPKIEEKTENNNYLETSLIFNEIFPTPEKGEEEWLEIKNICQQKINLKNWLIKDAAEKDFKFSQDIWLEPGALFLIKKSVSRISLNNDQESLQLFSPNEELIDELEYGTAPTGQAYARGLNDKWFWTESPTPDKENSIHFETTFSSPVFLSDDFSLSGANKEVETENFEIGQKRNLQGVVSVLPGIIGSQYFYLSGSSSLQIYNQKKDFPVLQIGDLIEVSGEISRINREWRLKTTNKEAFKIIAKNQEIPKISLAIGEIGEEYLGQLLEIKGEITNRKSTSLVVDDGTGEIILNIKSGTGIDTKKFIEGDYIQATGILGDTKNGLQLLPRREDDLQKQNSNRKVLGAENINDEEKNWSLTPRTDKKILYYLIVILLTGNIVLIALFIKRD